MNSLFNNRGVGAMEIVAMDMKLRGMYIARQLSFTGVTFKIEEVPLNQQYIHMYNKSVRLVSAFNLFSEPHLSDLSSQVCDFSSSSFPSGCVHVRSSSRPQTSWMQSNA